MAATVDLSRRDRHPELMDGPNLPPEQHAAALDGLARLNYFSNAAGPFAEPLFDLARKIAPRPLRVLDIATGSGDVPLALYQRALKEDLKIEFDCWDRSHTAIAHARKRGGLTTDYVRFHVHDAFDDAPGERWDAAICSLFLHHLSDDDASALLKRTAERVETLVLVSDLVRSLPSLWLARLATTLLTTSPVVKHDGPLSVRAAFTVLEAKEAASRAGMKGVQVNTVWPLRWFLNWRKA